MAKEFVTVGGVKYEVPSLAVLQATLENHCAPGQNDPSPPLEEVMSTTKYLGEDSDD